MCFILYCYMFHCSDEDKVWGIFEYHFNSNFNLMYK